MPFECAIPDSALSDCTDLRQKTIKVGSISRALAISKVERIVIYDTVSREQYAEDAKLMVKLLRFMDTPQYLRRRIFPISPLLKFTGLLPPLRIPSHPLRTSLDQLKDGSIRWGAHVKPGFVDIGTDTNIRYDEKIRTRVPIIFRISREGSQIQLTPISRKDVPYYFGYEVELVEELHDYLAERQYLTRIAFSRKGVPIQSIKPDLDTLLGNTQGIIAIFGGPYSGIRESVAKQEELKKHIDFWINTIPGQGTETVRLEEALLISTSILNAFYGQKISKPGYHR